jgi:lipoprotein-anchoring transpeptidase ErfK/SrfK
VKRMRAWSWGALACALLLVATACGGGGGDATLGKQIGATTVPSVSVATTKPGQGPPPGYSQTASAKVPSLAVYPAANAGQPTMTLPNPWVVDPNYPTQTVQQVFLVVSQTRNGWVQVLLPVRPNGTTGWVRASDVSVIDNPYRVTVELTAHRITVTQLSKVLYTGTVAVGAPDTPTPTGNYYLRVLAKTIDPTTVYGPYAYGLSSHSDALDTFNGGDAEIGIHGNNDASVLGSNVTHGCVRMDNDAITMLSRQLPLGTPVDIVA